MSQHRVPDLMAEPLSPSRPAKRRMLASTQSPSETTAYMPRVLLVTGGAGFIASHVVRNLLKERPSYRVVVIDRLDPCSNRRNLSTVSTHPNFKFVKVHVTIHTTLIRVVG